ncbi:hypothetical protein HU200_019751 [Digitaria exilis]|uniref:Uncharacterized protein n=1 Tax=Digitaria exilis TaxID=1010633 RepID=A0A835KF29_9POAL|nr:hypothetical protein HU200_019751 [Digitaria exilis]
MSSSKADGSGEASRSASAIVAHTARGCHILKIDGYSLTKNLPTGEYIKSTPFTVGGYRWYLRYYPNGDETVAKAVKAQYQFRFADEVDEDPMELDEVDNFDSRSGWGYTKFIKREEFEASEHLKDDSFAVRCDIILVPPSDIQRHLADLLHAGRGADVVFNVGGVAFTAHRWMLAARSAVFNAELFGMMKESDTRGVVHIHDMEPRVFKALLYFVYTDLFPDMTGEEDDDAMVQHLLVAADRYGMERLKLMCEEKLCKHIDLDSVAIILTLADQHHCCGLKKSCFDFLSSRENLRAFVASDSFQHLSTSCPSIIKELILR